MGLSMAREQDILKRPAPRRPPRITSRRIGIHTSSAGGVQNAAERAYRLGCNTFQIFSSSPRQWAPYELGQPQCDEMNRLRAEICALRGGRAVSASTELSSKRLPSAERSLAVIGTVFLALGPPGPVPHRDHAELWTPAVGHSGGLRSRGASALKRRIRLFAEVGYRKTARKTQDRITARAPHPAPKAVLQGIKAFATFSPRRSPRAASWRWPRPLASPS